MNKIGNRLFHPETEDYRFWTQEEELQLEKLVITGKYSFKDIGKIMNRSGQSCQDHSRILGFSNVYKFRKYTVDENFWSVPNRINSYYSGFSSADASIMCAASGYCTFRIEIGEIDRLHLEKFKEYTNWTGPIFVSNRKNKEKYKNNTVSLCVCSKNWANDLNNIFNIVPRKTKILSLPNLDISLIWCWLTGYICGDGTIHLSKDGKRFCINFVSASKIIIDSISQLIKENFKNNCQVLYNNPGATKQFCTPKKLKHANAYFLAVTGTRAAVLFDYLSQIQGLPKLDRKWLQPKVLEYVAGLKFKFPHLFKTFEYNDQLNQQIVEIPKTENIISHSPILV